MGDSKLNFDDKQDAEVIDRQLNLRLKVRLLTTHNKILRCQSCSSPIVESMHSEFKRRFEGRVWDCETQGCRNENKPERSRCVNCSKCIP